ncbi:MAG: hypothetical protein JWN77_1638 [Frankiales bacterium]|jgi:hypothetical protein|nr:hypothetical protein [Frankiales bacterium]
MRRLYGAHPLHLLSLLGCFALAGYAALQASSDPKALRIALWFLGALIAHDLVLFPLYALSDRLVGGLLPRRRHHGRLVALPGTVNFVRVPALLSGLLLLVFFPVVLRRSEPAYGAASGLDQSPYLGRWLLITGVLFLGSAVLYALRVRRTREPAHTD